VPIKPESTEYADIEVIINGTQYCARKSALRQGMNLGRHYWLEKEIIGFINLNTWALDLLLVAPAAGDFTGDLSSPFT
jgi:hypothetical protein